MTGKEARAQPVLDGVERVLALASTWLGWDGRPRVAEDGARLYTPNKVIRRHADHLLDHLAQIEALLVGADLQPDQWHGSLITLASDWAPFTEAELNEATQRLHRLGQLYQLRLAPLGEDAWKRDREPEWSIKAIVEHVADPWYAEQLGDLTAS